MINIATCVDNNYVQHCAVMLASLIKCCDPHEVNFFLIVDSVDPMRLDRMRRFCSRYSILLTVFDDQDTIQKLQSLKTAGYWTRAVWLRLFIPSLVQSERKLLYLDADTLLLGPVDQLYSVDVSRHAAAAVTDPGGWRFYKGLDLDSAKEYFNSGVMLMNLDYFRENNIAEKCMDFAKRHPERVRFPDQCALNHVLKGRVLLLDASWNYQSKLINKSVWDRRWTQQNLRCSPPNLVHYAGSFKPWMYVPTVEYGEHYWKHLKSTEFADYASPDKSIFNIIKKFFKHLIPRRLRLLARQVCRCPV